uniref:Titin n=1 Tax=Amphiprion percula TaxID=161767 RepID=A0A3P8SY05_AMPPE
MSRNDSGKYTVTAENSSGTKSAFVVVRVLDTPSAPVNLKVKEITNQSVTLVWEPPLLDGGSKIKNYIIEKRESTRKTYAAVVTNCHALSWKIEPLQEGCSYYFRVLAENAHGVGLPVGTADALKVSEVPQTPKNLSVTDQTKTSISLAWEKPEYDGGSRVMQYLLEVQLKGQEKWSGVNTFKTMEATVANLNPGEEYLFRVTAINDKGKSDPKVLAGPVMTKDLVFEPDARPAFSSYSVNVGKDMNIDIPIFGRPKPAVTWTKDGAPLKANFTNIIETEYAVTGLTENEQYEFRVIARNAAGVFSEPSDSSGSITATDELEPPRASMDPKYKDVIVVNAGEHLLLDADIYGKPIPDVAWLKEGKEMDKAVRIEVKTTQKRAAMTIKDVTKLDGGHYDLVLKNLGGTKVLPITVKVLDKPGPPTGPMKVTGVMSDRCIIAWSEPALDGGASISHYVLEKRETSRLSWTVVAPNIKGLYHKVTNLLTGNEYIFRVRAINKYGVGDYLESEPITARNPYKPPTAPGTPEASQITKESMVLSWTTPEQTGGADIEGYHLEKRDKDSVRWTKCNRQKLTDTHFKVTGLLTDHFYEFRVAAENEAGMGELSELSLFYRACDATTPPGPPHHPKVTDYSKSSAEVAPAVEPPIEKEWNMCTPPTGIQATKLTIADLKEGGEYQFRVCAINSEGVGEAANVHGTVVTSDRAEAPEIELDADLRKVVSVRTTVSLTWEKPAHDGGSKVMCYNVEFKPKTGDKWGTACTVKVPEATVPNLTPNEAYLFRVVAINEKGKSEPKDLGLPVVAKDVGIEPSANLLFNTYSVKAGSDLTLESGLVLWLTY